MRAEEAISVSNTYTENTVIGMGAIKGAPCTIKSITKSGNLNTVVFEWTDLNNVSHESTMLVYDGTNGTNGTDGTDGVDGFSPTIVVKSSTATEYILTITDKNGSYDTPNLKGSGGGGGASAMSDLTDVQLTSLANGQVLVYDGTASKWVNTGLTSADISYDNTTSGLVATKVGAAIDELAAGKVDKETGKGLSANDFTDTLKDKLDNIAAGAEVNTIEEVQVNGTALTPDANKAVNVTMELGGLTNVDLNNLQNGQIIIYDATNNKWVNGGQTGTTYTAGDGIEIDQNNVIKSKVVIYTGTKAAWDQLTVAQKIVFTHACWTDDTQSGVVDNVPTQNSDNLVKSGGVWTGLDAKADKTALTDYQTKDLSAPITVGGTQETTVEGAVGAVNTLAAGKAEPATTLSGYGITDAYTKTETDGAITTEIEKLDVTDSAVTGSYVTGVSETNGKISVTREAADDAPTASSNKMVKSGGVFNAIKNSCRIHVYGAEWDGSSSHAWTRTDDAASFSDPQPYYAGMSETPSSPFDDCAPWSDMKIVEDADLGTLVRIPRFWYKWTRTETKMKLQIADAPLSGFFVSPAHADRGDGSGERPFVYVGRYHCAASTYKSTSGVLPQVSTTRANFRTAISNLHAKAWQYDFAMWWTINMLYLVEFADWNSQAKIGGGCSETTASSSAVYNMGSTDSMPYHTGTTSGSIGAAVYGANQYRYIENLWGNCRDWIDGIYFSDRNVYCIKNPANFSDTTGGTNVGTRANANGVVTQWTDPSATGFEYALYPAAVTTDSNYETYDCDNSYYGASGVVLYGGGYYSQYQNNGAFCLGGSNGASYQGAYIGSRLQKLP